MPAILEEFVSTGLVICAFHIGDSSPSEAQGPFKLIASHQTSLDYHPDYQQNSKQ
jgi:hypothetical protein